jgi:hypothetical protein
MTASVESPVGARMQRGRVPDFFIVGHPKCGTTALYETLRAHPQIYMPEIKELRFFASDIYPRSESSTLAGLPRTLETYRSLFGVALPEQRTGEASPLYLISRTAADEIAAVQPDARVIAILREPASFLRSLHLQWVRSHFETVKDLRKALSLEQARREGSQIPRASLFRPQILLYSDFVRYADQLRRYHAAFPSEQVLVLIYDDLRRDNETTMSRVLSFLEVDRTSPTAMAEVNPTVRLRSRHLDQLVHAVTVGRNPVTQFAKASLKALTPRRLRHRALSATRERIVYDRPSRPDQALMLELRRRYKGEVVALSEYLGLDLVRLWGYDNLD